MRPKSERPRWRREDVADRLTAGPGRLQVRSPQTEPLDFFPSRAVWIPVLPAPLNSPHPSPTQVRNHPINHADLVLGGESCGQPEPERQNWIKGLNSGTLVRDLECNKPIS